MAPTMQCPLRPEEITTIMKRSLSLASLGSLFALVACSAGTSAPEDGESDDELRRGKVCGGFAGIQCPDGQVCKLTAQHPDATGRCGAPGPGDEGGICGGIAGFQCKDGLHCKMTRRHPDASGKCIRPQAGEEGGSCGGFGDVQCQAGLVCDVDQDQPSPRPIMGMPIRRRDAGSGPPPGAVGLPMPPPSGTCIVEEDNGSGPPPGALGMPIHP